MKILAVDVYYLENKTRTCGVLFSDWEQETPDDVLVLEKKEEFVEYIPGSFYLRELPPIISFLNYYSLYPDILIVDGYITLKNQDGTIKGGLGQHLKDELKGRVEIVGVAKSRYGKCDEISACVYRGESKNPLFVQPPEYGEAIEKMHGDYRVPTLLKIMDQGSKNLLMNRFEEEEIELALCEIIYYILKAREDGKSSFQINLRDIGLKRNWWDTFRNLNKEFGIHFRSLDVGVFEIYV